MKRILSLSILCLVLLTGLTACDVSGGTNASSTPASTSVPTETATSSTAQPTPPVNANADNALTRIATAYYNAIKKKNYPQAYTYLDPTATDDNGKIITQSSFIQLAQSMDSEEGPVVSFDVAAFAPSVVMTVSRSHLGPYHAHLEMKQEGNTWKITSLDRI